MYRILIVDDEKMERDGVEFLIRRRSLPVRIRQAQNGQEALDMWREEPDDIVFMDIKMPVMNGIELCRSIRESNGNTVLVVLSAYGDFAYTQKAIQIRVDDYLLKPVSIEEFDNVLDNAMDLVRQRRSREVENSPPASLSEYRQDKQVADSLGPTGRPQSGKENNCRGHSSGGGALCGKHRLGMGRLPGGFISWISQRLL